MQPSHISAFELTPAMGIHSNLRDLCIDCWCDGCGIRMRVPSTNWYDGRDAVKREGWYTRGTDYGDPKGPAWEHFCSWECLDDDDPDPTSQFLRTVGCR